MSNGANLLSLQELDLELERLRGNLNELPELKTLNRLRKGLAAAKTEMLKVTGQRKDLETDLEDLAKEEAYYREGVDEAQHAAGESTDYRQVQDLEIELSNLAKALDKVAFDQKDRMTQLEQVLAREKQGETQIKRLEAAIVKSADAVRSAARDIQSAIQNAEDARAKLYDALDDDLKARYDEASAAFKGLAVERLVRDVPTLCRTKLTESQLDEVERTGAITTCPYCHRILVVEGEEA